MQKAKTATLAFVAEVSRVLRGPGSGVSRLRFWQWVTQAFWFALMVIGALLAIAAQGSWSWQYVPAIGIAGMAVAVLAIAAQLRLLIAKRDAASS